MVKIAHTPIVKLQVSPSNDGQLTPPGSKYDEVYLALGRFKQLLFIIGLFPISENNNESPSSSVVSGLQVNWISRPRIFSVVTFAVIIFYFNAVMWHYIVFVPNYLEAIIRGGIVGMLALFCMVNLTTMSARAHLWPSYFRNFQAIDTALDIHHDKALRYHVKVVTQIAIFLLTSLVGSAIVFAINKIMYGDFSGFLFPVGLLCYAIFINGSQILPEILFTCLCRALTVRIKILTERIQSTIHDGENSQHQYGLKMRGQLEKCRHIYLLLMKAIAQTNEILGGALFTASFMNPILLSCAMYLMVRESLQSAAMSSLKISLFFSSSARITSVCLFAHSISTEINKLKRVLFLIPNLQLDKDSVHELKLYIRCIKYPQPKFTAFGFMTLDKGFLSQVSGTVSTYALALLQVNQEEIKESLIGQGDGSCVDFK